MGTCRYVGALAVGLVVMTAAVALSVGKHVTEAIQHAQVAVAQGQQNYPDEFVKHGQEALEYARQAKQHAGSQQLDDGIRLLEGAVMDAENGYLEEAVEAAQEAIVHLSEAQ